VVELKIITNLLLIYPDSYTEANLYDMLIAYLILDST